LNLYQGSSKLNQDAFRRVISGQTKSFGAALTRFLLEIPAKIGLRNLLYSKGCLKIHTADVPVISIGNITAGGTGKTPLVIWICKFLQRKEFQCAILTRGYKTHTQKRATIANEPAILTNSCPHAKVILNPDRTAAATEAVNRFHAKVLVMDDGFQHRRLNRDLDIVTIDATLPFGYTKLLPAGLLREPIVALERADAVVLTRCDQTSETELTKLEEKLQLINPNMIIARSIHSPICVKSTKADQIGLDDLKGKKILAFCGVGNPDAFFTTIKALGASLTSSRVYDDHHQYTENCLADIRREGKKLKADLLLTTQKDWFSSPLSAVGDTSSEQPTTKCSIPFAYLVIELKFLSGEDKITNLIKDALAGKIAKK
jgi:tetraacyldisaccharide 4'-kinase